MIYSGYLRSKQLQKAFSSFCDTTRHLTKEEKEEYKSGNTISFIPVGLVQIVREYLLFKNQIDEFLSSFNEPFPPIVVKLLDEDDTLSRLKIILEYFFKENSRKDVKVPAKSSKKRKHEEVEAFNISQSNTSTPETVHLSKRKRSSLALPRFTFSGNKEHKNKPIEKTSTNRTELCLSSSDTSRKDEDDEDEQEEDPQHSNRSTSSPISQVLKQNAEVRKCCAIRLIF